jgi:NAD(P)-dependent dehydrogenase (short-subunit alcohol dehydrogenase family)
MMKVAVVTGAYKGLGLEWCLQLGQLGYQVVLTARDLGAASKAADELKKQGLTVFPAAMDVVDEQQIIDLASWLTDKFGKIDLLINNAGVNSGTRAKGDKDLLEKNLLLESLDPAEVLNMVHINAIGPVLVAKYFRQMLAKSNNPKIINIGSWFGSVTIKETGGNYSYAASKAALNMMNRALAFDIKEDNIISVVVNPGWVQTSMGGQRAKFTAEDAVKNLIENVMNKITIADTGKFFNHDGNEHSW